MGKHQLRLLRFALDYPGWHSLQKEQPNVLNAARTLQFMGLIDLVEYDNGPTFHFRIRQTSAQRDAKYYESEPSNAN